MGETRKQKFMRRRGLPASTQLDLKGISRWSGVSERNLQDVYDRGVGAHRTNPRSVRLKGSFKKDPGAPLSKRLSKEQWAFARVYAFLDKLEDLSQELDHDQDIANKIMVRVSKEGGIGKYGYKTALSAKERQASLKRVVEAGNSPLWLFRLLNVLSIYCKNRIPTLALKFRADRNFVKKRFLRWETRTKYGVPISFRYTKGPRVNIVKVNKDKTDAQVASLARKEHRRVRPGVPVERWVREALQNYSTYSKQR